MRYRVFIFLILLIPFSLMAEIRFISQSPDQISLEYRPDAYQVLETEGFTEIRAEGMALPLEAGVPACPIRKSRWLSRLSFHIGTVPILPVVNE
jgi:hypothetical protein